MKYVIYGINRISKDLLYIFDELNIVFLADDNPSMNILWGGYEVKNITHVLSERDTFDKVIICDKEKSDKEKRLKQLGLKKVRDYIFEEDLFDALDKDYFNVNGKEIVIWGTGQRAKVLVEWADKTGYSFGNYKFVDSYKEGSMFYGKKVENPDRLTFSNQFVIIAVARNQDIVNQLEDKGLRWGKDYGTSNEFMSRPSIMMKQTIFDDSCYDLRCHTMLNHAEILGEGNMICCCSAFISNGLGKVTDEQSISDIWASVQHKIMCLSNENRTYTFCKKNMCPFFIGKRSDNKVDLLETYQRMAPKPKTVALGHDTSCNLYCTTCRDSICIEKGNQLEKKLRLSEAVNRKVIPDCEFLIMAGDGEVFLSKVYESIYFSESMKKIKFLRFLTNGMLFNERKWIEIRKHTDARIMLTVSIDAATKESYETIRRGGNFDVLKKNMEYAAQLRKTGELSYLRFNFVVQKMNYKEMPRFVQWGLDLGIDEVFFTKILNWGTYTPEEFKEISMMEDDGITPKPELKEVLNSPIMAESIVDLGTIRSNHKVVNETEIYNYYRWELERKVPGLFNDREEDRDCNQGL